MTQEWKTRAKCLNLSVGEVIAIFDVGRGHNANRARRFCSDCPVKQDCLNYALVNNDRGIWAGTTEAERDSMSMITEMLIQDAVSMHKYLDDWRKLLPEVTEEVSEVIIQAFVTNVVATEGLNGVTVEDVTVLADLTSDDDFSLLEDPSCVRRYA